MKELHELKMKLMDELKEIAVEVSKKSRMTGTDLDNISKLTKSIERLCGIMEKEGGGYYQTGYSGADYSSDGTWRANMEGDYVHGHGHSNAQRRDSMGRYTNDGGYSSNGGYTTGGDTASKMEELMRDAKGEKERQAILRCIREMRG